MRGVNSEGLRIIEYFESCRLQAYQDIRKIWTVGYGSTSGVTPGMVITQQEAQDRLRADLATAEQAVSRCIRTVVNDNQFSACVSLCYNIGQTAFSSSSLVKKINQNQFLSAADSFLDWDHANGKVVGGLLARRRAERDLFLS